MKNFVVKVDLLTASSKEINDRLYAEVIHASGVEPKAFFVLVYEFLVGRAQGPRLPSFLKEIGKDKLLSLLDPRSP
jgi:lysyl-tRNA synthetase class 1